MRLEDALQMALVGKAQLMRQLRQRRPCLQAAARAVDVHI